MMFARKLPFAKRWAKETPSFAALPERKGAGTTAGASLHGPGGLLSTPGMGGRLRKRLRMVLGAKEKAARGDRNPLSHFPNRTGATPAGAMARQSDAANVSISRFSIITTKPMTRSEAASVAAHARWDKTPRKAKPPRKGRKPAQTEQERQGKQRERDEARAAQRTQNRADVLRSLNIAPDGAEALAALRDGRQPDAAAIARAGFVDAGLVEQAADGSYRMTPAGRAVLSAADAGDRGRAGDTISGGRDRVSTRRQRQQAAEARKKKPPVQAGGGDKEKEPKPIDVGRRMSRINRRLARMRQRMRGKSFIVFKDYAGAYRWIARTTTAYRDRDGEIITTKALEDDAARMTATGQYGPLRYWHIGEPDPFDPITPWGPGLDIGTCDYSIVIGRTSIESGTFKSAAIGKAYAESAADYELSPGFFHPPDQPNAAAEFDATRRFERSTVPIEYGRASNLFTGLTVKEHRMDPQEYERRMKAFAADMQGKGVPPDVAGAVIAGMQQADKSAQQQGIAYKSAPATVVIGGVTYTAAQPVAPESPPDVVIDGVTYKAMPPELAAAEEKDDFGEGELAGEEMADMGMDDAQLIAAIAEAVRAAIAPMFGDMKMSELKAMLSGVATKDDSRAQQVAQLEATLKSVQNQLAQLTGLQPNVTLPADIEAALKSTGPQAPPDPNTPAVPADATPLQRLAIQTMPQLYQTTPAGAFNGWTPPTLPQS